MGEGHFVTMLLPDLTHSDVTIDQNVPKTTLKMDKKTEAGFGGQRPSDIVPGTASCAAGARGGSSPSCRFLIFPPNTNRLTKTSGRKGGNKRINNIVDFIM